jgi:hypothetical protein
MAGVTAHLFSSYVDNVVFASKAKQSHSTSAAPRNDRFHSKKPEQLLAGPFATRLLRYARNDDDFLSLRGREAVEAISSQKIQPFIFFLLLLSPNLHGADQPSLTGKLSNFTSYFFSDGKLRHERFEALLTQEVPINSRISTTIEGRARVELTEIDVSWAPRHNYNLAVRNDEMLEAEFRQLYVDYLGDSLRVKAGLQLIDWVDSLSPFTNDILTPYDIRFGAMGDPNQVIQPVIAIDLNHSLFGGNMEWLVIPLPGSDRLPAGPNGYGYYELVNALASPATANLTENSIPRTFGDVEFGARYHHVWDALELSLLAFRGHYRSPTFTINPISMSEVSVQESFPISVTLGAALTYGTEAAVFRLFSYVDPQAPARYILGTSTPNPGQRVRIGVGADYVFSKDLKIYSEFTGTYEQFSLAGYSTEYIGTIRMTSETIDDLFLSLNASVTFPENSFFLGPECDGKLANSLHLKGGARVFVSYDASAPFEMLKNSSQIYSQLEYTFDLSD